MFKVFKKMCWFHDFISRQNLWSICASRSTGIICGSASAAMCKALCSYKLSKTEMLHFSWRHTSKLLH